MANNIFGNFDEREQYKVTCSHCKHTMIMPYKLERIICSYCKKTIYRNKKIEFQYKMKEMKRKLKK